MDFTDDWGSVGSAASEEEVKQPTVVSAPEGTAESTAPHPQPQIPSSSQIAALLSAGLNEPESGEVILGPGQPSTSGGLIPEGSRPAQTTANPSKEWRRPVSEALRRIGQGLRANPGKSDDIKQCYCLLATQKCYCGAEGG